MPARAECCSASLIFVAKPDLPPVALPHGLVVKCREQNDRAPCGSVPQGALVPGLGGSSPAQWSVVGLGGLPTHPGIGTMQTSLRCVNRIRRLPLEPSGDPPTTPPPPIAHEAGGGVSSVRVRNAPCAEVVEVPLAPASAVASHRPALGSLPPGRGNRTQVRTLRQKKTAHRLRALRGTNAARSLYNPRRPSQLRTAGRRGGASSTAAT